MAVEHLRDRSTEIANRRRKAALKRQLMAAPRLTSVAEAKALLELVAQATAAGALGVGAAQALLRACNTFAALDQHQVNQTAMVELRQELDHLQQELADVRKPWS